MQTVVAMFKRTTLLTDLLEVVAASVQSTMADSTAWCDKVRYLDLHDVDRIRSIAQAEQVDIPADQIRLQEQQYDMEIHGLRSQIRLEHEAPPTAVLTGMKLLSTLHRNSFILYHVNVCAADFKWAPDWIKTHLQVSEAEAEKLVHIRPAHYREPMLPVPTRWNSNWYSMEWLLSMIVAIRVTLCMILRSNTKELNITIRTNGCKRSTRLIQLSAGLRKTAASALRILNKVNVMTLYKCCDILLPVMVASKQISEGPGKDAIRPVLLDGIISAFGRLVGKLRKSDADGDDWPGPSTPQEARQGPMGEDTHEVLRKALLKQLRKYAAQRNKPGRDRALIDVQCFLTPQMARVPNPLDMCTGKRMSVVEINEERQREVRRMCELHNLYPDDDQVRALLSTAETREAVDLYDFDGEPEGLDCLDSLPRNADQHGEAQTGEPEAGQALEPVDIGARRQALMKEISNFSNELPALRKSSTRTAFLQLWSEKSEQAAKFPTLARLARLVALVSATSVADERSFSRNRSMIGLHRSSLDPVTIEWLALGREWWDALLDGENIHRIAQGWTQTSDPGDIISSIAEIPRDYCLAYSAKAIEVIDEDASDSE